jgi:hypothetical protein
MGLLTNRSAIQRLSHPNRHQKRSNESAATLLALKIVEANDFVKYIL